MKQSATIQPEGQGKVVAIKIKVKVEDCEGEFSITDILLQGGSVATQWCGHPSEQRWSFDE